MEDRCVCCGAVIPEGRQVCLICDKKIYGNGTGGTAELKSCPFCGGKAKLEHLSKSSVVYCRDCRASTKAVEYSPEYASDEKAIEAWNRRAEDGNA